MPPFSSTNPPPAVSWSTQTSTDLSLLCDLTVSGLIDFSIFQDRPQPISNPLAAGTPSFLEGLAFESLIDLASIPSAHTTQTSEDDEELDAEGPRKRSRTDADPDEVTSSLSGSGQKQGATNPISATPLASMPTPARIFGLSTRYNCSSKEPTEYSCFPSSINLSLYFSGKPQFLLFRKPNHLRLR